MEWEDASSAEEGELEDSPRRKFSFTIAESGRSSFGAEELSLMKKRALRFGLEEEEEDDDIEKEMRALYRSLSILTDEDVRHAQFDTVRLHGTEEMTTDDVFEYFFTHKPIFLEWIDENSCNVVWKDNISAARAMVFYSRAIEYSDQTDVQMEVQDAPHARETRKDAIDIKDIPVCPPPGRWRAGAQHPKSKFIFLRFGNKSDKKLNEVDKLKLYSKKYDESSRKNIAIGKISESMKSKMKALDSDPTDTIERTKNPWGDLCKSWGINDSQEVFVESDLPQIPSAIRKSAKERIGLPILEEDIETSPVKIKSVSLNARLGKRRRDEAFDVCHSEDESEESSSDEEWKTKSKAPRMRMHADDEEDKIAKMKTRERQPVARGKSSLIKVEVKNEVASGYDSLKKHFPDHSRGSGLNFEDASSDVRFRLGNRQNSTDSESDDSGNRSRTRSSVVNKADSDSRRKTVQSTVWSRLDLAGVRSSSVASVDSESENSETDIRSDLRHALLKKTTSKYRNGRNGDLRKRIEKKDYRSPLRIEFDNELYSDKV